MRLLLFPLVASTLLAQAPAAAPAQPAAPPAREPGMYATINTTMGPIVVRLFEKEAPMTVQNFMGLARGTKAWSDPKTKTMVKRPMYNGITFHRVIANFMIQAGDPTATGSHDCGFTIKDEIVPSLKFDVPGRLAMANIGSPNTGACQWFITEVPYPSLNGGYTIFGQVADGMDVVKKIAHVPTRSEKPVTPVRITSITFKREGAAPAVPAAKKAAPKPAAKKAAPGPAKK